MNKADRTIEMRRIAHANKDSRAALELQLCDDLEKEEKRYLDLLEKYHRHGSNTNENASLEKAINTIVKGIQKMGEEAQAKRDKQKDENYDMELNAKMSGENWILNARPDEQKPEEYWWCPVHGKVAMVTHSGFHVCGVAGCNNEVTHRTDTDEKGGTRPPDEHHELQDFADKRTAPDEAQTEKLTISTFQKTHPSDADELRCLDCGVETEVRWNGPFGCWVRCSTNKAGHTVGPSTETEAEAITAYRKLIDDRAIADRARAERSTWQERFRSVVFPDWGQVETEAYILSMFKRIVGGEG